MIVHGQKYSTWDTTIDSTDDKYITLEKIEDLFDSRFNELKNQTKVIESGDFNITTELEELKSCLSDLYAHVWTNGALKKEERDITLDLIDLINKTDDIINKVSSNTYIGEIE